MSKIIAKQDTADDPHRRHWIAPLLAAAAAATVAVAMSALLAACGSSDRAPATYASASDRVQVTGGAIAAATDSTSTMRVFRGIPYAQPPVGPLRWKPPQPVSAWSGVRNSDRFSSACVMGNRPAGQPGSILFQSTEPQSEDCLYLNVWTGAAAGAQEKRPVMVLVHGGGLQLGAGSQPNYRGAGLASKGAVVVTMNYRLGALGFLAFPALSAESADHVSGNYGLLDVIAVLKWVKHNIAAFGGDAGNVTVYSESAGSQLSSVLLASPPASGLFHRIVIESLALLPAGASNPTLAQAEAAGQAFASGLGATALDQLRAMSATDIMKGTDTVISPVVDGKVFPDQLDTLYAQGKVEKVPMLVGWNQNEATPYPPFATSLSTYNAAVTSYGASADAFRSVYPVSSDSDVLAMAYSPMRDNMFAWQPWTVARWHAAKGGAATYLYFFTRHPPYYANQSYSGQSSPEAFGAYHSLEQVYFYNNLDVGVPARPYTDTDRHIADVSSSYLINFARTGNPNGSGLPQWPAFTGTARQTMEIGDAIAPTSVPFTNAFAFWDSYYTQKLDRALPF
ncbi:MULTISPECIES: carboxylesterase/lipase family protein [Burkholderia cepacia complex]|nr:MULTISPECIES: carboxylesterase family protein [Burkholderia cepacia complex]ABK06936.1 Carboxylesterase, type B [Burkholderia cenocepacia HI2424]MBJ9727708.1 carboxylesterase family protein [Burkholderia cenocepacia]MCA8334062.1 carboxylesterase family protein [Burkholderia cepacia]MDN7914166.1 carboxylesterase family protein [Burkholderia cepacia]MDR5663679.1 carboxylesterase family protein [Burkholderia cenocepacia]